MDLKCTIDGHLLACVPSISSNMEGGKRCDSITSRLAKAERATLVK